jgi:succinylarginine dihydrolase
MTTNVAVTIPQELTDQQTTLTTTITSIDTEMEKLANQRHEAEQSLARINRAVGYLKGEIIPVERPAGGIGARRPMSQAGKDAIRAGLLASSARKKAAAASAASPTAQIVADAPTPVAVPDPLPESPKAAKKGGK